MAHAPGSFSKNFAWGGVGLRKLHTAIRRGFHGRLSSADRQAFRSDSGIEGDIVLIPLNFFLHNRDGRLSVDELVYRAVRWDHALQFDRLALFALNLNRVGGGRDARSGRDIVSRPAMWANDFVRNVLWVDGTWRSEALEDSRMDAFLDDQLAARHEVRVKCRNNYRHLFELCRYLPAGMSVINSGSDEWISSAIFLAWDRHLLDGGRGRSDDLLGLVASEELHKLLGVPKEHATSRGAALLELYQAAGRLGRFEAREGDSIEPSLLRATGPEPPAAGEDGLDWLEQEQSDGTVARRRTEREAQIRDRRVAGRLKQLYNNECQFCGVRLQVGAQGYYAEADTSKLWVSPTVARTARPTCLCCVPTTTSSSTMAS